MAATLQIVKQTGGSAGSPGSEDVITTLSMGTDDQLDPLQEGTANFYPVARPTAGFNYSYWCSVALKVTGTFTDVRNIRFYIDTNPAWSLGTAGDKLYGKRAAGDHGCPTTSYEPAAGTQNETGYAIDDVTNGHDYYNSGGNSAASWTEIDTEGEIIVCDSSFYTAAFTSKSMVLGVKVDTDANYELMTGGQMTFRAQVVN